MITCYATRAQQELRLQNYCNITRAIMYHCDITDIELLVFLKST